MPYVSREKVLDTVIVPPLHTVHEAIPFESDWIKYFSEANIQHSAAKSYC